jgi:hypothetical protein
VFFGNFWYHLFVGRKLPGYFLIYLFSFCFFTALFHAVANTNIYADTIVIQNKMVAQITIHPTPTIFYAPTQIPTPTFVPPTMTPVPSPTIIPTSAPTQTVTVDLESLFIRFADEYKVDKEFLRKIAHCESGFNPEADAGLYKGMFQFAEQTWVSTRTAMGLDTNPELRTSAEESIRTAAYKIANGGQNAWLNCTK